MLKAERDKTNKRETEREDRIFDIVRKAQEMHRKEEDECGLPTCPLMEYQDYKSGKIEVLCLSTYTEGKGSTWTEDPEQARKEQLEFMKGVRCAFCELCECILKAKEK